MDAASLFDSAWGKFVDQVGAIVSAPMEDTPAEIAPSLVNSARGMFRDLVSWSEAQHESASAGDDNKA